MGLGPIVHDVTQWALALAGSPWILLILFTFCVIDGFFPPLPSESLIIAIATLSQHGAVHLAPHGPHPPHPVLPHGGPLPPPGDIIVQHETVPLIFVFLAAWAGAFVGDMIAYQIGKTIPVDRISWLRSGRGHKIYVWAKRLLRRRGSMLIFSARFIPVGRVAVNISAGATHFSRLRFIRTDLMATAVWVLYGIAVGAAAGKIVKSHPLLGVLLGIAGGIILGALMDKLINWYFKWRNIGSFEEEDHLENPDPALPYVAECLGAQTGQSAQTGQAGQVVQTGQTGQSGKTAENPAENPAETLAENPPEDTSKK